MQARQGGGWGAAPSHRGRLGGGLLGAGVGLGDLGCAVVASGGRCSRPAAKRRPRPRARAGATERREEGALAAFVDLESRNYKGERFTRFVVELHQRVRSLIQR